MVEPTRPVSVTIGRTRALTPSQELIWTSQRFAPDVPLANMAVISRFAEPVDADRFVAAWDTVVRASDALRTTIQEVEGVPTAMARPAPPKPAEVVELGLEQLDRWMAERIATPLDTTVAGYDSVLLDHGEDGMSWWCCLHHLITDAASSALVFQATADAYEGKPVELASYADLAERSSDDRARPRWIREAQYWAERSSIDAGPTPLYAPDSGPDTLAERVAVPLDDTTRKALDELLVGRFASLSRDLSLLTTLATATGVYLHRLSGLGRVTIGMPVHHRRTRAARSTIGPLVELFPLVFEVEPDDSFATVHGRVAAAVLDVLKHALPGTSARQNFDVVLNVHAATFGAFGTIRTRSDWIPPGHIDAHHRLRVQALDYTGEGDLDLGLDLNHRVTTPTARRRAGQHFAAVLDQLVTDPDASIHGFDLRTDDERAAVEAYNATGAGARPDTTVAQRIRRRLEAEPDRVIGVERSATAAGEVLTTAELRAGEFLRSVDALAAWFRAKGLRRADRVGLEMAPSADALIAVHACWAAGLAFVPIDPTYPEARRHFLRDDAGVALVLDALPHEALLHEALPDTEAASEADEPSAAFLDDVAYVIYTSGSTGQPKGVPITHRGLADYVDFAAASYVEKDCGTNVVMALFSSLSFDLTVTSFTVPLLVGGRLAIHPDGGTAALRQIAEDRTVTHLKATPSHLELLVRMLEPGHPLRTLVVGGEAFGRPLAARIVGVLGEDTAVFNEYGPTEAVVGCMLHRFEPHTDLEVDVPIGRPAPGVRLHVLDLRLAPVAVGCVGELFIHRPGMTSGYLNRDDLTAERFLDLPSVDPGLLYRTGDLVRMIDDSTMVYLGRSDEQIKVRGVRLEVAEVEAALASHPDVGRAVVRLWHPDRPSEVRHCARCGLPNDVPDISIDADGVCSTCHQFDAVAVQAASWFRTPDDLAVELADAAQRSAGDYDVLHLLSGGKDSTFALYRLVAMGARVLAVTLDNGFISEGAKDNVRRAVQDLGVDHEFVATDAMNEIFRDSLERFSNVCQGCYKTIYTLAVNRADELGIPAIVTGLSRGQFFETRLVPGMFGSERFDGDAIDATVLAARKAYHRTPDAVSRHLDVSRFETDDIFDRVRFVDFYRYVDVPLSEMLRFLTEETAWQRPPDTGRSTNCLINAAGIFVHQIERGHHNYALPYSWDVKLGHKTRGEAIDELDDPMGDEELRDIARMLGEVGYEPRRPEMLTAWIERSAQRGGTPLDAAALRQHLETLVPDHAIPVAFVEVDVVPLTQNGKVAAELLPAPTRFDRGEHRVGREPRTATERTVAAAWQAVLGLETVSAEDDFFRIGGASLDALEMAFALGDALGRQIPEGLVFRHRTVANLSAAIDAVGASEQQRRSSAVSGSDDEDGRALSTGEQALLFEWRSDPASPRYGGGWVVALPAATDLERFDDAVRAVVAHQPTLHTGYGPGRPHLEVGRALSIGRYGGDSPDDELARINQLAFDLVDGPLVRVHHLGDGRVALRLHHIVADAGSMPVLWRQIDLAYRGRPLPTIRLDYARHQRWQESGVSYKDRGHWLDRLQRPAGRLALVADRDRATGGAAGPAGDGFVRRQLSVSSAQARSGGGRTPLTALLVAIASVLGPRHTESVVELSLAASTREHPDVADSVGYFVNLLPLRLDVGSTRTVAALTDDVDRLLAEAVEHRRVPFSRIVRDARRESLPEPEARIVVAYNEVTGLEFDGGPVEASTLDSSGAVGDLAFVVEAGDQFTIGLEYRAGVLDPSGAGAILDAIDAALHVIVSDSTVRLDVLGAGDQGDGGRSVVSGPALGEMALLPELIARSVERSGDRRAVTSSGRHLTYDGLSAGAALLAEDLRAQGVCAGERVAVVVARSAALPVAVLAIWAVGASYVPIDIVQPADRMAELCASVGVGVAVVDAESSSHAGLAGLVTVSLDPARPLEALLSDASFVERAATDEAYVIFTSGSTGRPKPVPISHGNLAASTAARREYYADDVSRYLLVSSAGFDSSVAGLFWTLADGGELVIPSEDEVHDVDALVALIEGAAVTHLLCVPSLWAAILARGGVRLSSLRTVIVAGERCDPSLVAAHRRQSNAELFNEYGPTEATVWCSVHSVRPTDGARSSVPIGRPVPGVTIRVVDAELRPTPLGVAGELVVSGPTVSSGYLAPGARDAATPQRFVDLDGERAYRTGDRAVLHSSGLLDFLGRLDDQLSIGGMRVEPGEIEALLGEVTGVTGAAVVADGRLLVAFVESDRSDTSALVEALRDICDRRLEPRLRPSRFEVGERLPRTTNGKIDRNLLARRDTPREATTVRSGDAIDVNVQRVLDVWQKVFGRRQVDADADFFEIGGDSLRAVELALELEAELGRNLSIGRLYELRTPRLMASEFFGPGSAAEGSSAPDRRNPATGLVEWMRRSGTKRPIVLLPPGGGNLLRYVPLVDALGDEQPVLGLRLPGADAKSEALPTIELQATRLVDELVTAGVDGPYRLLGWSTGGLLAWEMARRLLDAGHEVDELALVDTFYGGAQMASTAKADKYRTLLHNGGVHAVVDEVRSRVVDRSRAQLYRARYRASRAAGVAPDLRHAERTLGPILRQAAIAYRPPTLPDADAGGPRSLFFAASATDPAKTVNPWTKHHPGFEVIEIEGSHFRPEAECIMAAGRVEELAAVLRLGSEGSR